jgi:hypothetical protein
MKKIFVLIMLCVASIGVTQDSLLITYSTNPPKTVTVPNYNRSGIQLALNSNDWYSGPQKIRVNTDANFDLQDPPFTLTKEQILQLAETSPQAKEYLKTLYPDLLKEVVDLSTARSAGIATIGIIGGMGRLILVQLQNNGRNLYGNKSLLVGDAFTAEVVQDGKDQLIIFKRK